MSATTTIAAASRLSAAANSPPRGSTALMAAGGSRPRLVDRMKIRPPTTTTTTRAQPRERNADRHRRNASDDGQPDAAEARDRSPARSARASSSSPTKRAPPRQRRRKVPVKFRRLNPSPSPTPDRRNSKASKALSHTSATAGGAWQLARDDDDDSSDQPSSPIGTFGALPARLYPGRRSPVSRPDLESAARSSRTTKRRRVELLPQSKGGACGGPMCVEEGDNGDVDVSDITYFPTLATTAGRPRSAAPSLLAEGDIHNADLVDMILPARTTSTTSISVNGSSFRSVPTSERSAVATPLASPHGRRSGAAIRARIDFLASEQDATAASRAQRDAADLLRSHVQAEQWTCIINTTVKERSMAALDRLRRADTPRKEWRHPAPTISAVREDMRLPAHAKMYRETLDDWVSGDRPSSRNQDTDDEAREFCSYLDSTISAAGYCSPIAADTKAVATQALTADLESEHALFERATSLVTEDALRARLASPRAKWEIVKLLIPISTAALHDAASDAAWIDREPLNRTNVDARPLIWLPGSFARFISALEQEVNPTPRHSIVSLPEAAGGAGRRSCILGYAVDRRGLAGEDGVPLPHQVKIYTTLDRAADVRAWLARCSVDGLGTRPFRLDRAGAKILVTNARGEGLLVF